MSTPSAVLAGVLLAVLLVSCPAAQASGEAVGTGGEVVSERPAPGTPHVLDGRVYSIARVGDTVLLGGRFSAATDPAGGTVRPRRNLLAFDARTGAVSTTFVPGPTGTVRTLLPAGDGTSVYVGGDFTAIGGEARQRLARLRVEDGSVVGSFDPGEVTGRVRDLELADGHLWVGGAFTHVGGRPRAALATLDPVTGDLQPAMSSTLAGHHRGGATQVLAMDLAPDGSQLVAVGNFSTLDGLPAHQLLTLDLTGPTAVPGSWSTDFYRTPCSAAYDSYLRDVDFSPDGGYLVVATAGGRGGPRDACDTVARFEGRAAGVVQPTWVAHSGGDSTTAVEVGDAAVYVGGHGRWWNNPEATNQAGPGAVARQGIAALDPANGLPLAWDPGRSTGAGVFDLRLDADGLWVGSDTDLIGGLVRGRIARMPLAGRPTGTAGAPELPGTVYRGGPLGPAVQAPLVRTVLDVDGGAGPTHSVDTGAVDWSTVRGAFLVGDQLHLAFADGRLERRRFGPDRLGPPVAVDGADRLRRLDGWHADAARATGMFLLDGRLYFTLAGAGSLFYRYFDPRTGVVGARRLVASRSVEGIDFSQVRGMVATDDLLLWATPDGALHRAGWTPAPGARAPRAGTVARLGPPGGTSPGWAARALFLVPPATLSSPPVATFDHVCVGTACVFEASGSSSASGALSATWRFGDGASGAGPSVGHDYAGPGEREVVLTVTDPTGATATTSRTVSPAAAPSSRRSPALHLVGTTSRTANARVHRVPLPADLRPGDALVAYLTVNRGDVEATGPRGWVPLEDVAGADLRAWSWTRSLGAEDLGPYLEVRTSVTSKAVLTVEAVRAQHGDLAVVDHAALVEESIGAQRALPAVTLPPAGGWVTRHLVVKSSVTESLASPSGSVVRALVSGVGEGRLTGLSLDPGAPSGPGRVPAAALTSTPAVTRSVAFTTAYAAVRRPR